MRTVQELMNGLDDGPFVGRDRELDRMSAALASPTWRALHLHGMGGLGKSSLLRAFCRLHPETPCYHLHLTELGSHRYSVLIEGAHRAGEPGASVEVGLDELPERIRSLTTGGLPAVVIIDSFQSWKDLYPWLRQRLLRAMDLSVRLFTASRLPLDPSWTDEPDWAQLVAQLELRPLDQTASFKLIEAYGIEPFETCHYLAKLARGLPLALRNLCEDTVRDGIDQISSRFYQKQFYDRMSRYLLREMGLTDAELDLLDAASLLWNFDLEVISHLLQQPLSATAFRRFCQLPIVEPTASGWRILHVARYWFRKEFAHRAPERYASFRQRAKLYWLERMEPASREVKRERYANLLHLTDNDALHTYCFQASPDLYLIRPLPKEELGLVREMFVAFHETVPAFLQDTTHQEQYLETYWELSPDTFYGFYRGGKLAMFMSMLPLTWEIRNELQKNPVYREYILGGEGTESDTVMWIASFLPEYGASAVGLVFLHGFTHLAGNGRMVVMTPFLEGQLLNDSIGHERLQWADYTAENGLVYKAYRLDLSDSGILDAILDSGSNTAPPSNEARFTPAEAFVHVKDLLAQYYDFERDAELVNRCPFMQTRSHSRQTLARAAAAVRKFVAGTLDGWVKGQGASAVYGEILRLFYIQRIGTHERIATRLNLSLSTYYRHLRKGTAVLAEAYIAQLRTGFE